MKKCIAAVLSTAMVMGTFPMAAMAEETISDELKFVLTAEGESMTAVLTAEHGEDGVTGFSGSVTFPAAMMGEEMTFALEDLVRTADGDLYLNVKSALDLYYELTGDTSMTMLATMVGIDQPWVKIPALDLSGLSMMESTESVEADAEMLADLYSCLAPFEMTETENGVEIAFDGSDIGICMEMLMNVYKDCLEGMPGGSSISFDYKTVFGDYILAAAEGINAVTPEVSVEDGAALICDTIDSLVEQVMAESDTDYILEEYFEEMDYMVEELKETLTRDNCKGLITIDGTGIACEISALEDGAVVGTLNGNVTLEESGLGFAVSMTSDGETMDIFNGAVTVDASGLSAKLAVYDNDVVSEVTLNAAVIENGVEFTLAATEAGELMGQLNGKATADDSGFAVEVTLPEDITFAVIGTSVKDGAYAGISVPEDVTLLRDVVKNAVIIYGSMMAMEEETAE